VSIVEKFCETKLPGALQICSGLYRGRFLALHCIYVSHTWQNKKKRWKYLKYLNTKTNLYM